MNLRTDELKNLETEALGNYGVCGFVVFWFFSPFVLWFFGLSGTYPQLYPPLFTIYPLPVYLTRSNRETEKLKNL
jgi:hypothetical protein